MNGKDYRPLNHSLYDLGSYAFNCHTAMPSAAAVLGFLWFVFVFDCRVSTLFFISFSTLPLLFNANKLRR